MSKPVPVVYLLHGSDEFAIKQFVEKFQEKLGDPSMAAMNTSHLEGSAISLDDLHTTASAIPFLTPRRLVIVTNLCGKLKAKQDQQKLLGILQQLPETTALVLVESKALAQNHWLVKSLATVGERAFIRAFDTPKGSQMAAWVRKHAAQLGGEITPQAASLLAEMAGDDPRMAANEVEKLLAYVNYQRPIDLDDVDNLAAFATIQGDFFVLIDAIGSSSGHKAMEMLQRLFAEREPLPLFFSLVSNFRMLLLTREVMETGQDIAQELGIHPYRAKKLGAQARSMDLPTLEAIYRRLLEYDHQIKTGQIEAELALELLVATLTSLPA
ncbi:MAG: DNA polymerase III subunit delta [Anaerolineae bacterium]|nr:DNA polymerase III subunit delta [Anaerolineae bacterium]